MQYRPQNKRVETRLGFTARNQDAASQRQNLNHSMREAVQKTYWPKLAAGNPRPVNHQQPVQMENIVANVPVQDFSINQYGESKINSLHMDLQFLEWEQVFDIQS